MRAMMRNMNPNNYLSEAESLLQLEQRHQVLETTEQAESLSDFPVLCASWTIVTSGGQDYAVS